MKYEQSVPQLYIIPLGSQMSPAEREMFLPWIPAQKRERLHAFRHWQDAQRTLLGYSLLSQLLNQRTGIPREKLVLTFDYYGKPHLEGSGIHFNLSHSGDWIACVIGDHPIGVDVEGIQPIDLEIANHFFAKSEVADLMILPAEKRLPYFFTLWSLKESYIKAEGLGVSIPLDSFWFHVDGDGAIQFDSIKHETKWRFRLYEFDPCYKLAVCVAGGNLPERAHIITRDVIKDS